MRFSWWRFTQPAKASTRKCRAWGMAGGYMAQTRPSPTLSRGFTRLGRFLAPYGLDHRLILPLSTAPPPRGRVPCRQRLGGMLNYSYRSAA